MRFVSLPRVDGTRVFVNPTMVKAVAVAENDKTISLLQFDNEHVIMIREPNDKVAEILQANM